MEGPGAVAAAAAAAVAVAAGAILPSPAAGAVARAGPVGAAGRTGSGIFPGGEGSRTSDAGWIVGGGGADAIDINMVSNVMLTMASSEGFWMVACEYTSSMFDSNASRD